MKYVIVTLQIEKHKLLDQIRTLNRRIDAQVDKTAEPAMMAYIEQLKQVNNAIDILERVHA